jgi:SAM-dependent methyltransferase
MVLGQEFDPPPEVDWREWVDRWERMQEGYLVRRSERFATIVRLLRGALVDDCRLVDLGCGPGSLTEALLEAFPQAEVWAIDVDPTMLLLAMRRLSDLCSRVHWIEADLRRADWLEEVPSGVHAVVSSTALHWLSADHLSLLYQQIGELLCQDGIFLNADHVGSSDSRIQKAWEENRQRMRAREGPRGADDWDGFWTAYMQSLGLDDAGLQATMQASWEEGVEEGLPLAWHLDKLRSSGFRVVDCYWRLDCDAIYGGIKAAIDQTVDGTR